MSKCLECGYYDKEKHYCPLFCQLIRETLDEAISFELEKIKTRIDKDVAYVSKWQVKNDSIKIIDERISELKGENNDE